MAARMGRIRAVLFDLDGVLVDAAEWHYQSLNRALQAFGCSISRKEHLNVYNGLPTREKLDLLGAQGRLPASVHSHVRRLKQAYTRETILKLCRPVPRRVAMLRRLARDGYTLCVCSNSIRETVDLVLRRAGLLGHVKFFLSNEDVLRPKPDPEIYRTAMKRLDCRPEEVVIVEDSAYGVEAARRSGGWLLIVSGTSEVNYALVRNFIRHVGQRAADPEAALVQKGPQDRISEC